jgi:hypothetical protein
VLFGLGTDGPPVLHNVAGHRNGNPHDRHRGQKQHAIQNTHSGQHNKVEGVRVRRCGFPRIGRLPSII